MFVIKFILVLAVAFVIGAIGFPQIIGSFQHRDVRSIGATVFTILFWTAILVALTVVAHKFFSDYLIAYYMGIVSTFFMTPSNVR